MKFKSTDFKNQATKKVFQLFAEKAFEVNNYIETFFQRNPCVIISIL